MFEVAICIMHMSLDSGPMDLLSIGGHVLAGYLHQMALNDAEWRVLKESVCARYCHALVLGAYSYSLDPSNDYVLITAKKPGWDQLKTLWETPKERLYSKWQSIIRTHNSKIVLPDLINIV